MIRVGEVKLGIDYLHQVGAIEDFEIFIEWAQVNGYSQEVIDERIAWVEALSAGDNPFTPEVLEELRNQ